METVENGDTTLTIEQKEQAEKYKNEANVFFKSKIKFMCVFFVSIVTDFFLSIF